MPPKTEKVTARCMKCKEQKPMSKPKLTKTVKGTNMLKGKCPECDTTMCRIVSKDYKE